MVPARLIIATTAVVGVLAFVWLSQTPNLPAASQGGTGPEATLVLFSDQGERLNQISVGKIVKSDAEWRRQLTSEQYAVTRKKSTEFSFHNLYWNQHSSGIYRCICCGNAVFRSQEKFDSDTGWPSFWAPIAAENIAIAKDTTLNIERTEVLCRKCDAHLGHVFDDGPPPTGLRYCLNSAALRFIQSK